MNLKKLCIILAVVSGLTAFVGIIICLRTNHLSDEFDSAPLNLNAPGDATMWEGRYCTMETSRAMRSIYEVDAADDGEGKSYRYYPVVICEKPQRFVLVCVPEEDFAKYDVLAAGSSGEKLRIRGTLERTGGAVRESLQMLFTQIRVMDPNGQQDYDEMFLSAYYVEPVEPKDYSGLMTAGLWMVIAGLVLGAAGGIGVWYCKHQEFLQSLVSAEEFERSGRGK